MPYWTNGERITTAPTITTHETVYEGADKLYGLGSTGNELVTVRIPDAGTATLMRMPPTGADPVDIGPAEDANGGLAVGPGRDPSPRVSVERGGKQITALD